MTDLTSKKTTWRKGAGYPYHTLRRLSLSRAQRVLGIDTSKQRDDVLRPGQIYLGEKGRVLAHTEPRKYGPEKASTLFRSSTSLTLCKKHKVLLNGRYNLLFLHKAEKHSLEDAKVYAFVFCYIPKIAKPFGFSGNFYFVEELTPEVVEAARQLSAAECLVV